jgi:hypothetical protein
MNKFLIFRIKNKNLIFIYKIYSSKNIIFSKKDLEKKGLIFEVSGKFINYFFI